MNIQFETDGRTVTIEGVTNLQTVPGCLFAEDQIVYDVGQLRSALEGLPDEMVVKVFNDNRTTSDPGNGVQLFTDDFTDIEDGRELLPPIGLNIREL